MHSVQTCKYIARMLLTTKVTGLCTYRKMCRLPCNEQMHIKSTSLLSSLKELNHKFQNVNKWASIFISNSPVCSESESPYQSTTAHVSMHLENAVRVCKAKGAAYLEIQLCLNTLQKV